MPPAASRSPCMVRACKEVVAAQEQEPDGIISAYHVMAVSWRPDCKEAAHQNVKYYLILHVKLALTSFIPHHSHYRSWHTPSHQYPASSLRSSNPSALSLASSPPFLTPRTLSKANYPRHPQLLYGQQLPLRCWPSSSAIFTACLEW